MAKRVVASSLGILKTKPMTHGRTTIRKKKKKKVLQKVLDFLKSDYYMFAPLLFPRSSHLSPPQTLPCISPVGVHDKEPIEEKDRKLVKGLEEFLKADCHMYSPLVITQPWLRASTCFPGAHPGVLINENLGGILHPEGAKKSNLMDVREQRIEVTDDQPAERTVSVVRELTDKDSQWPGGSKMIRRTVVRRETVKQMIHHKS